MRVEEREIMKEAKADDQADNAAITQFSRDAFQSFDSINTQAWVTYSSIVLCC